MIHAIYPFYNRLPKLVFVLTGSSGKTINCTFLRQEICFEKLAITQNCIFISENIAQAKSVPSALKLIYFYLNLTF